VSPVLDERPIIVAVAGPNGAGKSTFYEAFLRPAGLRYVNADDLARDLQLDAYAAAKFADQVRESLLSAGESFVFETVFSDPAGAKLGFMKRASENGYSVVLVYIGIEAELSEERVAIRVLKGGHDVPSDKLATRYPRTLSNLRAAIRELPNVLVYDNSDLAAPFRAVAEYIEGRPPVVGPGASPRWFSEVLDATTRGPAPAADE
jgi:predicted ABC-type ATPase